MRRILSSSQCYFWSCFILIPWGQDSPPYANEETKACELNRLALGHRGNEVRFQLLTPAASVTSACLLTNYIPLSRRCTLISTGHNPQTVETSATEDNKCFWAAKWSVDSQLIDYFDKVMISSCACKCQHMQMAETSQTNSECPHEQQKRSCYFFFSVCFLFLLENNVQKEFMFFPTKKEKRKIQGTGKRLVFTSLHNTEVSRHETESCGFPVGRQSHAAREFQGSFHFL